MTRLKSPIMTPALDRGNCSPCGYPSCHTLVTVLLQADEEEEASNIFTQHGKYLNTPCCSTHIYIYVYIYIYIVCIYNK